MTLDYGVVAFFMSMSSYPRPPIKIVYDMTSSSTIFFLRLVFTVLSLTLRYNWLLASATAPIGLSGGDTV